MKSNKVVVLLNDPSSGLWPFSPSRGKGNGVRGFTLIELLVVVLIIGILAAVVVPMYQRAVYKSRFSKLMLPAKTLASANEVFFLGNGEYATTVASLDVGGDTASLPDGSTVDLQDTDDASFVRLSNAEVPHARYVVYQQKSANFAGATMCEAEGEDDKATWLCDKGLNGTLVEDAQGNSGTGNWTAYLLTGTIGQNDQFGGGESEPEDDVDEPVDPQPQTPTSSRALEGDPACSNKSYQSCTYTYTNGDKLVESIFGDNYGTVWMRCDENDICTRNQGGGHGYTGFQDINDRLADGSFYHIDYDYSGNNIMTMKIHTGDFFAYYNPDGSRLTNYSTNRIPNSKEAYYDAQGNVREITMSDGNEYYYNANGTAKDSSAPIQNVSSYKLTEADWAATDKIAQQFVGKTKCQIYPELQSCQN